MVSLFKDRSPASIIWLFLLSIIVHSHFFVHAPVVLAVKNNGLISLFLNRYFVGINETILLFSYHAMVLIMAFRFNFILTGQRMYSNVNYLPAMVFIILTGILPDWNNITPAFIANFPVIWIFGKIVQLYNSQNPKTLIFNIGLIIGGGILLYQHMALFVIVALFALLVVRPFSIPEIFVLLMGVLTPFYFLFSYLYIEGSFTDFSTYLPSWQFALPIVQNKPVFFTTIGTLVLLVLWGIYHMQEQSMRMLIQVRKNWGVLYLMVILMLPLPFLTKDGSMDIFIMWIVPASPFIAKGFMMPRKTTLHNIIFWFLILLCVLNNYSFIKN